MRAIGTARVESAKEIHGPYPVAFALMESCIAASHIVKSTGQQRNPEQVSLSAKSRNWTSAHPTELQCSVCGNREFGGPRNIPIITHSYFPDKGGVARSVHSLGGGLRQTAWNALVLTPQFDPRDDSDVEIRQLPPTDWDRIIANDFRTAPDAALYRRIFAFKPDVIHIHGPFHLHLGPVATRLADDLALSLVYTHHTKWEEFMHYGDGASLTPEAVQTFYAGFANQCARVPAPSGVIAHDLQKLGVRRPLHVMPSGLLRHGLRKTRSPARV